MSAGLHAVEVHTLDRLREGAKPLSAELSMAEGFTTDAYRVGYIRFSPRTTSDSRMIVHQDQDVVCLVLSGRGLLDQDGAVRTLGPGDVCRIAARTPHDFSAVGEPLELFYTTIRVGARTEG